ncbi:UPF0524 protein C3orf70 homolog isoform X2 [Heterocephalus glaber]|uniref:UPF0524 protein C3orf70 homolog isoform X2 n=1 Tax=Heterocephalus glaber TaxID=10181 RepID=A0AAX6NQW5_HETGA|nr:UPF0524 protein C3orf70 homolog isoform X2 [Heterocephalus glaber]
MRGQPREEQSLEWGVGLAKGPLGRRNAGWQHSGGWKLQERHLGLQALGLPEGETGRSSPEREAGERKAASIAKPPLPPDSPRYCMISDLFIDNYQVKCINGKMCYVQKQPAPHSRKTSPEVSAHDALNSEASNTPKIDQCSSPSSSEDSGINAIGAHYVESCDEDTEEGAELSSEEDYSPESSWEPDECTLLSPSQSDLEVIETMETTV